MVRTMNDLQKVSAIDGSHALDIFYLVPLYYMDLMPIAMNKITKSGDKLEHGFAIHSHNPECCLFGRALCMRAFCLASTLHE